METISFNLNSQQPLEAVNLKADAPRSLLALCQVTDALPDRAGERKG